jgi:GT2 family glycosyltransferase
MENKMVMISVIISTLDRPLLVQDCLYTILKNELEPYEIMVVDQSRGQDTERIIRDLSQQYPRIAYLRDRGKGASRAKNLAIQHSRGEVLAFTDDDCLVSPKWLLNASKEFAQKKELACLVGRVVRGSSLADLRDSLEETAWEISGKTDPWNLGPSGGNFFIRRNVLDQIGLFDETLGPGSFFRGAEDADLVYRIMKIGMVIQYNPAVTIVHRLWRTEEEDLDKRYGYGLGVGAFLAKHLTPYDPFPLYIFLSRFSKKPLKLILGIILFRKDMWQDGYYWSRGIVRGFWERKRKQW